VKGLGISSCLEDARAYARNSSVSNSSVSNSSVSKCVFIQVAVFRCGLVVYGRSLGSVVVMVVRVWRMGESRTMKQRCSWVGTDPLYLAYHDLEWGVPVHDEQKLFEFLILEGAQAGLSWLTILKKRAAYRAAFADFEPEKVALFTEEKINELMKNSAIIRNRRKITGAVQNARAFLAVQREFGTFDQYIWQFVQESPLQNCWRCGEDVPARTQESEAISKDLKSRGFTFVGPTICYAFMQAIGMVNDHQKDCFRYQELNAAGH
jgi:DNA-3-methyladenine glycosylase I